MKNTKINDFECPICKKHSMTLFTKTSDSKTESEFTCSICGFKKEVTLNKQDEYISKIARHRNICETLRKIYEQKNHDYGDSFHKSYEDFGLTMAAIRIGDKYNRFKNLIKNNQQVVDESLKDTLLDLANYAIMTVIELDEQKEGESQ